MHIENADFNFVNLNFANSGRQLALLKMTRVELQLDYPHFACSPANKISLSKPLNYTETEKLYRDGISLGVCRSACVTTAAFLSGRKNDVAADYIREHTCTSGYRWIKRFATDVWQHERIVRDESRNC